MGNDKGQQYWIDGRCPDCKKKTRAEKDPSEWIRQQIEAGVYENKIKVPGKMSGADTKDIFRERRYESRRIKADFQKDLEQAFLDLDEIKTPNPIDRKKCDLLFRLAWEHGHSAGFTEVLIYYEEMVPLLTGNFS
jgi:hypothetical protein